MLQQRCEKELQASYLILSTLALSLASLFLLSLRLWLDSNSTSSMMHSRNYYYETMEVNKERARDDNEPLGGE